MSIHDREKVILSLKKCTVRYIETKVVIQQWKVLSLNEQL